MTTSAKYLYGVILADGAGEFGPIGLEGGLVHIVSDGGIGIVASPAERIEFSSIPAEKTLGYLAQHQRVLERVMTDASVIPLKFGTYADDDGQIMEILRSGRSEFARALERYGEKVEVDLAAFWTDLKAALTEIAGEESVVTMKAQIASQGAATLQDRLALGKLVRTRLDERREQAAGRILAELRGRWPHVVVNPTRDDAMIFNAAVLIGRREQASLEDAIRQLDRHYDDRLHFRCVGPLPPYSFATAEVKVIGASGLDGARRRLGLGESASLAEMKAAYRRLLQELHPDGNPDVEAADHVKEVSDAYGLLEEYALNFRHTFGAAQGGPVIVKVRSLDDLRGPLRENRRAGTVSRLDNVGAEAA
jgi:hypothetical protein